MQPWQHNRQLMSLVNILLFILVLCLLALQAIDHARVTETAGDSREINVAGQQRTLSQVLSKTALELATAGSSIESARIRAEMNAALTDMRAAHEGLQFGSADLDLPGNPSPTIRTMFTAIDPYFRAMASSADCMLQNADECDHDQALRAILANEPTYLTWMDAITYQYDRESDARLEQMRQTGTLRLVTTIVVLLTANFGIIIPANRSLRRAVDNLVQTQDALRKNEAQLRSLLDSQSAFVFRIDAEDRLVYANPAWEKSFSWFANGTLGTSIFSAVYEDDRERVRAALTECRSNPGEVVQVQVRKLLRDGGMMWTLWECTALGDGNGSASEIQCIGVDVTKTHQMQEALRRSERRFATAFQSSPVPVTITTIQADEPYYVEVNDAYCALVGYERSELIGRNLLETGIVTPGPERDRRVQKLQTVGQYSDEPAQLRTRTGEVRDVVISAQRSEIDGNLYDTAILLDVTEKQRSAALAQEVERLKQGVRNEQQHFQLVQQTFSTLSHDLRTPLAVITTAKDTLDRYSDRLTPEKRQEKLDSIGRQVQFIQQLLYDLTMVIKGNLSEREFNPASLNLAALCQVSVDEIRESHPDGVRLKFINRAPNMSICGDEVLISRILLNLLTNALKYSPDGGEVILELAQDAEMILLRVTDQGIGIPADDLPHIFDTFYRATGVEKIMGTGLGLSIVKDCVARHHGTIAVESELGKGTTFTVKLPQSSSAPALIS